MTDKYLSNNAGVTTEKTATVVSAGGPNAGNIVALNGSGTLDNSVLPTGIGADTASIVASEAISAGMLVNIWNNAGTPAVRKADATIAGKEAHGFVLSAVASGATATVYFAGNDTGVTGLTGGNQFLSTTAGLSTGSAPTGSGNAVQRVGVATSATNLQFEPAAPVILA